VNIRVFPAFLQDRREVRTGLAGIGAIIFFLATAFLLGRVYFELAAMRFHPIAEAKRLRKVRQGSVFLAGLIIAGFVSIPIANLATPLFGMALMDAHAQTADESARRFV
jgi:uncharacterized protein involved in cysteine biosynthesis